MTDLASTCANCGDVLAGEYCSRCGQRAINLHRPFHRLLSEVVVDAFDLDTRAMRTLRRLLFKPGQVAKDYNSGRRATHLPPVRTYLIAALVFFGLFTIFPSRTPVEVVFQGSAAEAAARSRRGGRVSFSLPPTLPFYNEWYQAAAARAMKQPEAYAQAVYEQVPRAFFVLLPLFAIFLELVYRRQGFLIDHLVFSVYYHAFVFLMLSLLFVIVHVRPMLPALVSVPLALAVLGWLFAYLPIALRRAYGGRRWVTALKLVVLGVLYFIAMTWSMLLLMGVALLQF